MAASSSRLLVPCPYSHLYRNTARGAGCATVSPVSNGLNFATSVIASDLHPASPARLSRVRCHAESETLYEVLGVSESATAKEVKAAYRKKAVKLHPDVNTAPDAKEQFMRCKTAYETLMDDKSRAAYDRARKGGFASGVGGDFGADWDSFGKYARDAARSTQYTYSDLMRDLDRELEAWQRERERKKGRRAESPTDVLGDIAEEFLDFLEMGAGIASDEEAKRSSGSSSSASSKTRPSSSSTAGASSGASSDSKAGASSSTRRDGSAAGARPRTQSTGTQTETDAEAAYRAAAEEVRREAEAARARAAGAASAARERARRDAEKAADIEDELAALKRRFGR